MTVVFNSYVCMSSEVKEQYIWTHWPRCPSRFSQN